MQCGRGHSHATVAEVRACYGLPPEDPVDNLVPRGPRQHGHLTEAQKTEGKRREAATAAYRASPTAPHAFTGHCPHCVAGTHTPEVRPIKDRWKRDEAKQENKPERGRSPLPDIPEGHYAVPSLTGNNDLDFFRVDKPSEGKWKGRTYIVRIIGGHPDTRVPFSQYRRILEAILEEGVEEAAIRYGHEIGRCYKCNRTLTDDESRAAGIGPVCAAGG